MMDITLAKTISTIDTVIRHPGMSFDQNYHFTKWYYAGSRGIQDENVIGDWSSDYNVNDYSDVFIDWIKDYSYNTVTGIDNFIPTFSNGTTQAFDSFYMAHHSKRFRIFPEEYYYHYVQLDNCMDYAFLSSDNLNLQENDAVILSWPFANTGNTHPLTYEILNQCSEKNIPVLLDLCYYFISQNQHISITHSCIDTVAFSLSKVFPVGHYRIGLRLSKHLDGQNIYHNHGYYNHQSALKGIGLMKKFPPRYIFDKYRGVQEEICNALGIDSSDSILFGTTTDKKFQKYSRDIMGFQHGIYENDSKVYRVGLVNPIENWKKIKNAIDI